MRGSIKRFVLLGLAGGIFLACVYGVVAYQYWNNPPRITHNYAAELNAPMLAVPSNQKAWPIYREALFAIAKDEPRRWRRNADKIERVLHEPEIIHYVLKQEPTLRRVRAASKLPSLGFTLADDVPPENWLLRTRRSEYVNNVTPTPPPFAPSENPQLMNVLLTAAAESSELFQLLSAHAHVSAERGDIQAAVDDIDAMIGVAEQIREIPLLVHDLISLKRYGEALATWGQLLTTMPEKFTKQQLLALEVKAKSFCGGRISVRIEGERAAFGDLVQRSFTDDGQGDGYGFAPQLANIEGHPEDGLYMKIFAPLLQPRNWSRRRNAEEAERLFAICDEEIKRPFWNCDCEAYSREIESLRADRSLALIQLMLPHLGAAHATQQSAVQKRDAILTASVLTRYRLDNGTWPDKLEELVPQYLPAIPPDQFTGKPLGYSLVDDEPMVYSVGYDKHDDGGVPALIAPSGFVAGAPMPWYFSFDSSARDAVGDLILWPVQLPVVPLEPEPPEMEVDR